MDILIVFVPALSNLTDVLYFSNVVHPPVGTVLIVPNVCPFVEIVNVIPSYIPAKSIENLYVPALFTLTVYSIYEPFIKLPA